MQGVERAVLPDRPKDGLDYCSFNGDKRQREEAWEDCYVNRCGLMIDAVEDRGSFN